MRIKEKGVIKLRFLLSVLAFIVALTITVIILMTLSKNKDDSQPPSTAPYYFAAISSDGSPCAQIGVEMMKSGGYAADAAIAASICSGVVNPHSMGLGGGFLLTYYSRADGRAYTLNSREVAPSAATENMFGNNPELAKNGALSVAVPAEMRGYQALYMKFGGGVSWAKLFDASIDLCEKGNPVNSHLAMALDDRREYILNESTLHMFVNEETGDVYKEGDILYLPKLGETLRIIQQERDAIHNGSLTNLLVEDLQELGGIITETDYKIYEFEWNEDPLHVHLENLHLTMYSIEPPGSGALLAFIMNVLDGYGLSESSLYSENEVLTHQRIVETFKYAYASRTKLGDHNFVNVDDLVYNLTSDAYAKYIRSILLEESTSQEPEYYGAYSGMKEDHGTSHVSILAPNGDAVAITGTINSYFGALIASERTGIIFNNQMDNFDSPEFDSLPGKPSSNANLIEPGKRPMSSMSPAIFVSPNGDVRLVTGAAGGTQITTAVAYSAMQNLWFGQSLENSTQARRIHHQLFPMVLNYEVGFSEDILGGLEAIGHFIEEKIGPLAAVSSVSREEGYIYAVTDNRKGGQVDGF